MNTEIRRLFEDIIKVLNLNDSPIEAKRLILVVVLGMIEKQADETIAKELEAYHGDAEGLSEDKLAELSE